MRPTEEAKLADPEAAAMIGSCLGDPYTSLITGAWDMCTHLARVTFEHLAAQAPTLGWCCQLRLPLRSSHVCRRTAAQAVQGCYSGSRPH
jgi:hypothetical protein